jgi:hypothetical protein
VLRRSFVLLIVLVVCLTSVACKKITKVGPGPGEVDVSEGIPAEFGRLVSVTPEMGKGWNLWFEREDGSIVRIWLSVTTGISEKHLTIQRR